MKHSLKDFQKKFSFIEQLQTIGDSPRGLCHNSNYHCDTHMHTQTKTPSSQHDPTCSKLDKTPSEPETGSLRNMMGALRTFTRKIIERSYTQFPEKRLGQSATLNLHNSGDNLLHILSNEKKRPLLHNPDRRTRTKWMEEFLRKKFIVLRSNLDLYKNLKIGHFFRLFRHDYNFEVLNKKVCLSSEHSDPSNVLDNYKADTMRRNIFNIRQRLTSFQIKPRLNASRTPPPVKLSAGDSWKCLRLRRESAGSLDGNCLPRDVLHFYPELDLKFKQFTESNRQPAFSDRELVETSWAELIQNEPFAYHAAQAFDCILRSALRDGRTPFGMLDKVHVCRPNPNLVRL